MGKDDEEKDKSNERNLEIKDFISKTIDEKGAAEMDFEWKETGVPKEITIDGDVKKVQYMRDGILQFADGMSATYEDLVKEPERRKIRIKYNPVLRNNK